MDRMTGSQAEGPRRTKRSTRELLLAAAREEFARRGLEGARVDDIARLAGVNKQLVYHHFGNKDDLYRAVIESVYAEIRSRERELDLTRLDPLEAMRRLIEFSFDYLAANRDFIALLTDENIHEARHVRQVADMQAMHSPLIELIGATLRRGQEQGLFREGVVPRQLYISIAGMAFFYFSNIHTLSAIFNADLSSAGEIAERRVHIVDLLLHGLHA